MTATELCASIEHDTAALLDSVDRRLARLDAALAASAALIESARSERDRIVATFAEGAAWRTASHHGRTLAF